MRAIAPARSVLLRSFAGFSIPTSSPRPLTPALSMSVPRLTTPSELSTLLKYETFLFDCDGVLWEGDHLIDGAKEVLEFLRSIKKRIIFVTNNATKSRVSYKEKFDHLGIEAYVEEIFGSAYASAVYISTVLNFAPDERVYVIGQKGIEEELAAEGISFLGGTSAEDSHPGPYSIDEFRPDPSVKAVLCGLDMDITYRKIARAYQYLTRNEGCRFIVTNEDSTYPVKGGLLPGAGAVSAPLRYMLKRDPVSIGKPNKTMLDCIVAKVQFDKSKAIMVGDRLDTDIMFGRDGGIDTCLVMTGIAQESDLSGPHASDVKPTWVMQSVGDLRALFPSTKVLN